MTTAREIVDALGLEPNQTCGYVRVTFGSPLQLPAGTLPHPYTAARPLGSALYFLVAPEAPVRLHRIANDQLYHYYAGDPLDLVLMLPDGSTAQHVVGGECWRARFRSCSSRRHLPHGACAGTVPRRRHGGPV